MDSSHGVALRFESIFHNIRIPSLEKITIKQQIHTRSVNVQIQLVCTDVQIQLVCTDVQIQLVCTDVQTVDLKNVCNVY